MYTSLNALPTTPKRYMKEIYSEETEESLRYETTAQDGHYEWTGHRESKHTI